MVQNDVTKSHRVAEQCGVNIHSPVANSPRAALWGDFKITLTRLLFARAIGLEYFHCIQSLSNDSFCPSVQLNNAD
ncbi:hypothetical protein TNCV_542791 [Trichonephila clavipes]|nr:hypothetical protein TNCV_542791 [Trichonephila clavipes]